MSGEANARIAEFWRRRGEMDHASAARFHNTHTRFDQALLKSHCASGSKVLDLGAGTLAIANWLVSDLKAVVHAVDNQSNFFKAALDDPRLTLEVADVRDYVPAARYDAVLLFGVIQHLIVADERASLYQRCAKALELGGVFIVKSQFGLRGAVEVNGYSDDLGMDFYSLYPALNDEVAMLESAFPIVSVEDIFPPDLSPHENTKFRHILCRNKPL